MMDIEVRINGEVVDISSPDIAIDFQTLNISDLTTLKSDKTSRIALPRTATVS